MRISEERLLGVIAGVFLFQFLRAALTLAVVVAMSWSHLLQQLGGMVPEILGGLVLGLGAYGYLFHGEKQWIHIVMIGWLGLKACLEAIFVVAEPFLHAHYSPTQITRARWEDGTELVMTILLLAIVCFALLRGGPAKAGTDGGSEGLGGAR